ncbi:MAG: hypothetical protein ABIK65_16080 [Candidatus Eisenbacteria bacterium]
MTTDPKNRSFFDSVISRFGASNIRCKVAKIYGTPDDTLSLGALETWYYFGAQKGFVFRNGELERIVPLRNVRD